VVMRANMPRENRVFLMVLFMSFLVLDLSFLKFNLTL
jgi:hypothetical protein